jgi:hypothetical protein
MAGLVPAIHALLFSKAWMPGTRPGMTKESTEVVGGKTAANRRIPNHEL